MLQLRLSADGAEDIDVTSLKVSISGTAIDTNSYTSKDLYLDDGDGIFEPGGGAGDDFARGSDPGGFGGDDGDVTFGGLPDRVLAGASVDYWVALDVGNAPVQGATFAVSIAADTDVTATGVTSGALARIAGTPANGNTFTTGSPSGLFDPGVAIALTSAATVQDLGVGDFNGDGDLDFVVLRGDGFLELHRGQGDGTFLAPAGTFPASALTGALRLDVANVNPDQDGDLDVVVVHGASLSILTGDGAGGFNTPATITSGGASSLVDVVVVDYNRDGKPDVVTSDPGINPDRIRGYTNQGGGAFLQDVAQHINGYTLGTLDRVDWNQDGITDLVIDDDTGAFQEGVIRIGDGTFFGTQLIAGDRYATDTQDAVVADLDRNGYPDLVGVQDDDTYQVVVNTNPGVNGMGLPGVALPSSGAPIVATTGDAAVGDWNGDGKPDLAITHSGALEGIGLHLGNDTLIPTAIGSRTGVGGADPDRIATGDFDHDGDPDLIVGSSITAGGVHLFLGDGLTNGGGVGVSAVQLVPWTRAVLSIGVADLDGDGHPDVIAGSTASDLQVFLNDGDAASFTAEPSGPDALPSSSLPFNLKIRDVDRDGNLDVVTSVAGGALGHGIALFTGNGDGTLNPFTFLSTLGLRPGDVALEDLDGDGFLDAVVTERDSDSIQIFRGNATGFDAALPGNNLVTGDAPEHVVVRDMNNDGLLDLVVMSATSPVALSEVDVFVNQGGAFSFNRITTALTLFFADHIDVGDINRDGNPDVVVVSGGGPAIQILEGDGDGTFTDRGQIAAGIGEQVALVDLDKDGDLDLIQSRRTEQSMSSHENTDPANFTFGAAQVRASVGTPEDFVVTDMNRDGEQDVVVGSTAINGGIHVYFGE